MRWQKNVKENEIYGSNMELVSFCLFSPFSFPSLHSFPNQEQDKGKSVEDCCTRRDRVSTEECLMPTEKLMCVCLVMPAGYVYVTNDNLITITKSKNIEFL